MNNHFVNWAVDLALEMIERGVDRTFACKDAADNYGCDLDMVICGVNSR